MSIPLNRQVADKLRQAADLLAEQGANPFRVSAYRRAAGSIEEFSQDIAEIGARDGEEALRDIPGIGPSIARAVAEILRSGRWGFLEHLRGSTDPESLFRTVPGIGPILARRLHEELNVNTLEALENAARDGRLARLPGIGRRRAAMIESAIAAILSRARPRRETPIEEPSVALLLAVDRDYLDKARADTLPKIAPKRFNPKGEAWLAILHSQRGPWHFTALFSNTARAHELDRIGDWVVIYFHSDHGPEAQRTVVTESRGELAGKRVVRGRETECRKFYADTAVS